MKSNKQIYLILALLISVSAAFVYPQQEGIASVFLPPQPPVSPQISPDSPPTQEQATSQEQAVAYATLKAQELAVAIKQVSSRVSAIRLNAYESRRISHSFHHKSRRQSHKHGMEACKLIVSGILLLLGVAVYRRKILNQRLAMLNERILAEIMIQQASHDSAPAYQAVEMEEKVQVEEKKISMV